MAKTINRAGYLNDTVSHREYYASIAKSAGISLDDYTELIARVRASEDKHLNDIPLGEWDRMGAEYYVRENMRRAFKEHGDSWSLAGSVCVLKEVARQAAERPTTVLPKCETCGRYVTRMDLHKQVGCENV